MGIRCKHLGKFEMQKFHRLFVGHKVNSIVERNLDWLSVCGEISENSCGLYSTKDFIGIFIENFCIFLFSKERRLVCITKMYCNTRLVFIISSLSYFQLLSSTSTTSNNNFFNLTIMCTCLQSFVFSPHFVYG